MTKIKQQKSGKGKEREEINNLTKSLSEPEFLLKKNWAIKNVKFKLEMIDYELSAEYKRIVMQKIEPRIKKPDSIARKLTKKGYAVSFAKSIKCNQNFQ